ncbi:MAG: ABC transporter substrate-binding protein [Patescibacteria group bacterium]
MNILSQSLSFLTALFVTFYPQKTYIEGFVGQPTSFFPHEALNENDKTISKMLFRGLFTYDKEGVLTEDLADSLDVSDDGLEYTVYLKKGQKWSNGNEITADDLLYSAFTAPNLKEIATDKINKYTIRYSLPNKFSPFPHILTQGVIPATGLGTALEPVSSGPYQIVRIKKEGPIVKEVLLQSKVATYKIPRIAVRYYENNDQLFTAFKLGEIDGFISPESLVYKNLQKLEFPLGGIYYSLIFNTRNEKLEKSELRKKLAKATPIAELIKRKGVEVKGPISQNSYTSGELNFNEYDANYTDNLNLKLEMIVPNSSDQMELGKLIQKSWAKVGVELALKPKSSEDIEKDLVEKREFEVLLYGQEVSRDPDRYALWHSTRSDAPGLNLSGFDNVRLDRSLEEGRNAIEVENRKKHYGVFQEVIFENAPVVFLYHPILKYYHSDRIEIPGDALSNTYYSHGRFADFKNWDIK